MSTYKTKTDEQTNDTQSSVCSRNRASAGCSVAFLSLFFLLADIVSYVMFCDACYVAKFVFRIVASVLMLSMVVGALVAIWAPEKHSQHNE